MANFSATARIPTRPLSYANKDLAQPKEILVDYDNHTIYICDTEGNFYDVTADVTTVTQQVIQYINNAPDNVITDVDITLPSGDSVTISEGIINAISNIEELQESLGLIKDELGNISLKVNPNDVETTTEKQFVSADEKAEWNGKASIEDHNITIPSGFTDGNINSNWAENTDSNNNKYYTYTAYTSVFSSSCNPVVDVRLSDDYTTSMNELKNYGYIYKILINDGSYTVYASQRPDIDLNLIFKINS